jgi:hypothetical protein
VITRRDRRLGIGAEHHEQDAGDQARSEEPQSAVLVAEQPEQQSRRERADEHAEPERPAQQRQCPCAVRERDTGRHERVTRQAERRGADPDEQDGCCQHADVRSPQHPGDPDERDHSRDAHREPLADAGDGPAGGDVSHQLADDEGGRDEPGDGQAGTELGGQQRQQRQHRALAEGEQHGRPIDHRREPADDRAHPRPGVGGGGGMGHEYPR